MQHGFKRGGTTNYVESWNLTPIIAVKSTKCHIYRQVESLETTMLMGCCSAAKHLYMVANGVSPHYKAKWRIWVP